MLQLARDLRGFTQLEVSELSGITQGYLSKLEHDQSDVSVDKIDRVAAALSLPSEFFFQQSSYDGLGLSVVYYRKRSSARVQHLRRLQAEAAIRRLVLGRLLSDVDINAKKPLVRRDIDRMDGNAEKVAAFVRADWRLPLAPIRNLVAELESAGGIVFQFSFGTKDIDAMHQWPNDLPPLFFVNSDAPADRVRFSLAHEIGHAIMHEVMTDTTEDEANRFAAELLMPEQAVRSDLHGLSIKRAAALKPYWRVSMAALIKRAKDVHAITDHEYRRLFRQLSSLGYRTREPISIVPEQPQNFDRLIEEYCSMHRCGIDDLSRHCLLDPDDFRSRFLPPVDGLRIAR